MHRFESRFVALCRVGTLAFAAYLGLAGSAAAVPSFARQTGLACAQCHVGAFGPQLTEFGREFKLNGYVWNNGDQHIPLAAMIQTSFTHTSADQAGGASPGFGSNNNTAVDQISVFYGGKLFDGVGAFAQVTYDGIGRVLGWDNLDVRFAKSVQISGRSLLFGLTINNAPTVQDAWNSTPAWGFPYAQSGLAPSPAAAALIDGGLAQQVLGAGSYLLWDDLAYVEADFYRGLGRDVRSALGAGPVSGSDTVDGSVPYWRLALQHDFGNHYVEFGTFGLIGNIFPGGNRSAGRPDRFVDFAFDATYLYSGAQDHILTGYLTYIRERQSLLSSSILSGANAVDRLATFRANGSYSYRNTITLSGQYFKTDGSSDTARYGGSPGTSGWIGEIAYVPSGKADSEFPRWLNMRISLQYTAYTRFDGSSAGASRNNTLFLLLWLAG